MAGTKARAKGRLSVFGLGPRGLSQLTLETLEIMKSCAEVVSMTSFQAPLTAFCKDLGVPVRSLDWGQDQAKRSTAATPGAFPREKLSDVVLDALARGGHVGLAVDGHPSVFTFAGEIRRRAKDLGHECRVYASLQPLDQMLAALEDRGERFEAGFAVFSALSPDIERAEPARGVGFFLYNLGHLLRNDAAAFERLRRRLVASRGAGQRVLLVECASDADNVRECTLKTLARALPLIGVNATAYVASLPGARQNASLPR